ncbi:baseplate J/gp47 family protein [Pseudonocardia sp.]|uniref:baseplate J/gp47 family protein n=1 Tax=Pseudonocardia sp. TaxID=60912 RepID=UPI003D14E355
MADRAEPPLVDPRDRAALLAQTTALAQRYSAWRPGPVPDPGSALIEIAARFAELVVDRINRAPARNYRAFLDLIGTAPLPAVPARVPLTFTLAEGGPAAAPVPAGTRVAGQPRPGDTREITFETEEPLVVTAARLTDVLVGDAENDTWSDRSAATGPWPAFVGDRPAPHDLLVACEPLPAGQQTSDVVVTLTPVAGGPPTSEWPLTWAYWDGTGWSPAPARTDDGGWRAELADLPRLPPRPLAGITAGWLRARLDRALPRGRSGLAPDAVVVGGRPPQAEVAGVYPFGEAGESTWFYLSVDDAVAAGGGTVTLDVALRQPGAPADPADPVRLVWSAKVGGEWRELGREDSAGWGLSNDPGSPFADPTLALTGAGTVRFRAPQTWPRELFRGRLGRWIRVQRTGGRYADAPRLGAVGVGQSFEMPVLESVTIDVATTPVPQPPPAAFAGPVAVDLSADFRPFGATPAFGETFLLACPDQLARPGATLQLTVAMTNAREGGPVPRVHTAGNPRVAWEGWDGTGWRPAQVDDPAFAFTADATVRIVAPDGFAPGTVHGVRGYWLRVRLVDGDYGKPASYTKAGAGYVPVEATLAPPMVRSLTWTPADGSGSAAATAVVSVDHGGHRVHATMPASPFAPGREGDPALYLGFDRPFARRPVALYLQVQVPEPEEVAADRLAELDPHVRAHLTWEYSAPDGWRRLDAHDGTETLTRSGVVEFVGPADLVERECLGRRGHWLRLRWHDGQFPVVPRLCGVLPNTIWAVHSGTPDRAGGADGNRPAGTVTALTSTVPYIDAVTNHEDARGGADPETMDRTAVRGPQVLRHGDRAVTAQDLEDLAAAASPEVARARAVPPARFDPLNLWLDDATSPPTPAHTEADAGRVGVVVVPHDAAPRPAPSLALLRRVEAYLARRCPVGVRPWVAGPEWVRVSVAATVVPSTPGQADEVAGRVRAALDRYLHHGTGGPAGTGWAFGATPHRSEVFAVVEAVPGVDHVPVLRIALLPESPGLGARLQSVLDRPLVPADPGRPAEPPPADLRHWLARALVYSGGHEITVTLGEG